MGLDILVAENIKLAYTRDNTLSDDEREKLWDTHINIYPLPGFESRADKLKEGFYTGEIVNSFRAGSYSGYNDWRRCLSQFALNAHPRDVWNNTQMYEGRQFFEIICFSDCEGTIGPDTSAKLYKDFRDNYSNAKAYANTLTDYMKEYFIDVYGDFMKAFETASTKNGAVIFA